MFGKSKRRHRRSHREDDPVEYLQEPMQTSHKRSRVPKRLLLSIWLLITSNFIFLIIMATYVAGQRATDNNPEAALFDQQPLHQSLYERAIEDAAYVGPERVSHLLQPLSTSNSMLKWKTIDDEPWVKVMLWVSNGKFQQEYADLGDKTATTPDEPPAQFVTLVPEVQHFCQNLRNDDNIDVSFRLKQYLGLNPHHRYERIVELWVPKDDLFRPCPDPETDDRFCNLKVDQRATPVVRNITDYPAFLRSLAVKSYQPDGRPWTRLGYTYDWANGDHGVGASEYMLIPRGRYRLAGSYTLDEYCGRDDKN